MSVEYLSLLALPIYNCSKYAAIIIIVGSISTSFLFISKFTEHGVIYRGVT